MQLSGRLFVCLLLATSLRVGAQTGLDLTPTAAVKPVVLSPVIYTQLTSQGGFTGFNSKKSTDKFDLGSLPKLVNGLGVELGTDKVISVERTNAVLTGEGLGPAQLKTPQGIARLAKGAKAQWVVLFELTKQGTLVARVHTAEGNPVGMPLSVARAGTLSAAKVADLSKQVSKQLVVLSQPPPGAAVAPPSKAAVMLPPPEADVEGEIEREVAFEKQRKQDLRDAPKPIRAVVALAMGAQLRTQKLSGEASADLASLQSGPALAAGFYVMVAPLQFVDRFAGSALSDLSVDVNFRRSFIKAREVSGTDEGQSCPVTDDEQQYRATFRYALGGYLPAIGLAVGYSHERAVIGCNLPVASAVYSGVDVQLRVKQPVFRDKVSIDLTWGPRFLLKGVNASQPDFSWAGEAWLEARPVSLLFVRGGARVFRAQLNDGHGLKVVDLRSFLAIEAGVYF